jgi:hypothetical protein
MHPRRSYSTPSNRLNASQPEQLPTFVRPENLAYSRGGTTSRISPSSSWIHLSFCGHGGDTLGAHAFFQDHRPDLKQKILGIVIDGDGRPICTEMWPRNTADVSVLLPVVDQLRRPVCHRPCVRGRRPGHDLGQTIAGLEERNRKSHAIRYLRKLTAKSGLTTKRESDF